MISRQSDQPSTEQQPLSARGNFTSVRRGAVRGMYCPRCDRHVDEVANAQLRLVPSNDGHFSCRTKRMPVFVVADSRGVALAKGWSEAREQRATRKR
jgi:hypothetical protein